MLTPAIGALAYMHAAAFSSETRRLVSCNRCSHGAFDYFLYNFTYFLLLAAYALRLTGQNCASTSASDLETTV